MEFVLTKFTCTWKTTSLETSIGAESRLASSKVDKGVDYMVERRHDLYRNPTSKVSNNGDGQDPHKESLRRFFIHAFTAVQVAYDIYFSGDQGSDIIFTGSDWPFARFLDAQVKGCESVTKDLATP